MLPPGGEESLELQVIIAGAGGWKGEEHQAGLGEPKGWGERRRDGDGADRGFAKRTPLLRALWDE